MITAAMKLKSVGAYITTNNTLHGRGSILAHGLHMNSARSQYAKHVVQHGYLVIALLILNKKRQEIQPTLASFWKVPRVDTSLVETVAVVSDNDNGSTDVNDKGTNAVYKGIISSDHSNKRCDVNCEETTDESSSEVESVRDSDIMDSHDTGVVGVESNTDSQPVINLHKAVSVINHDPEFETASRSNSCDGECCNGDCDRPYQPRINYLTVGKKRQRKFYRSFQSSWYVSFKWLSYCMTHNRVFCHYCRTATTSSLVSFSKKNKDPFVSVGFDNWKKALERFREHEVCHMHTESYMKLKLLQQKSIANQLTNLKVAEQKCNREMLYKVLSSLKYLLRQLRVGY